MPELERSARATDLPLTALRAFESTARHGSMTKAAAELNVTHGAVSRQIAALERVVGTLVFERGARGVRLTQTGQRLFLDVQSGFERLRTALHEAGRAAEPVRLTTLPSFATRWLLPRLAAFHLEYPTIDVRVHSSLDILDLATGHYDLGIRYGRGSWAGLSANLLASVTVYPVCSPEFLERSGPVSKPSDLLAAPLIHNSSTERWADWFAENGVAMRRPRGGIVVDDYALALEYALSGQGVALGRDILIQADLAAGRLIAPVPAGMRSRFAYYLVRSPTNPPSDNATLFAAWLERVAAEPDQAGD